MGTTTKDGKHEELEQLKVQISERVEGLRRQLHEAEKSLLAVTTTIELLKPGSTMMMKTLGEIVSEHEGQLKARAKEFAGLTQIQALVKIAKESPNYRFKITAARDTLISVGLIKSKKNASNILWNAIQRSEKFKRTAPGEYELLPEKTLQLTPIMRVGSV